GRGADAVHAAAADGAAVPAGLGARVRVRDAAPRAGRRRGLAVGDDAVPDRALGRVVGVAELLRGGRAADHRVARLGTGAWRRAAVAGVPVVRGAAVVGERADQPAAAAGARVLLGPRGGLRVLAPELSRRGTAGAHRGRGDLPADSRPG